MYCYKIFRTFVRKCGIIKIATGAKGEDILSTNELIAMLKNELKDVEVDEAIIEEIINIIKKSAIS